MRNTEARISKMQQYLQCRGCISFALLAEVQDLLLGSLHSKQPHINTVLTDAASRTMAVSLPRY